MKQFECTFTHGGMERVGIYSISDVMPFITNDKKYLKVYDGHEVKMFSLRYHTFNKSLKCIGCGIEGKYFALERFTKRVAGDERFHFNLYAVLPNGQEVLMTKDHINPKSLGGRDHIDNLQTMCKVCNELKMNWVQKEN